MRPCLVTVVVGTIVNQQLSMGLLKHSCNCNSPGISCSFHNQASLVDSSIPSTMFEPQCHGWESRNEGGVKPWDTIKSVSLKFSSSKQGFSDCSLMISALETNQLFVFTDCLLIGTIYSYICYHNYRLMSARQMVCSHFMGKYITCNFSLTPIQIPPQGNGALTHTGTCSSISAHIATV